jgi:glycosyltransferase involved in cell wall biosynthesis
VFAAASGMVLASLPSAGCMRHPFDVPHCFWEEQFGLVLAEAMAASLAIVASRSGAIPEVCRDSATYFEPGDWMQLAHVLAAGPLARAPAERVRHPADLVERYSTDAAAVRLAAAYGQVLGSVSKLPT